jgi:hypothetical protein
MNWSSLLPSTLNPEILIRRLLDPDHNVATQALRDIVIFLTLSIAVIFALCVLWQTLTSWSRTRPYLKLTSGNQVANAVITSDLSLFHELRHHLIEFPSRDGTGKLTKRRTVDAAEVLRESVLGPSFSTSRLILAIPSILTGLGVLGTFVGLQLGIGSLDFSDLEKSIRPLIQGCAVAFSSSVWGVGASLLFSWWEKAWEGFAVGRVHKIHVRVDALFPRYVPEEALADMERTSRGTEDLLKGLAVAIGAEMQTAIGRLGAEIKDAVMKETGKGQEDLGKKGAELMATALTAELVKLKEQIASMSDKFSEGFNGASEGLMKSVQHFQPTVEALSGAVGDAQRTVTNAVEKLNAHESVMLDMAGAAANIRQAAEVFGTMNEPLTLSATRNEEASKAQLFAAQTNERVAEQFGKIGERLPEIRDTLKQAAEVIASITGPILSLKNVVDSLPTVVGDNAEKANKAAAGRDEALIRQTGDLAAKVEAAAAQFAKVEGLAEKLAASATSLDQASNELAVFGQQVQQASKEQRDASEASRAAAVSGERTAKALEPLPDAIIALTSGLESAGSSVRTGAEAARDSYRELIVLQKEWFAGAEIGLNGMKDRLQNLLRAYGDQVEGQTSNLMRQWTEEVTKCLQSYETQVSELQGGLDELQSAINKLRK